MVALGRGAAGWQDQRRWPRLAAAGMARARWMGSAEEENLALLDLSPSGMALRAEKPLQRGAVMQLSFDPHDGGSQIQVYAEVAWARPGQGAGLRFIGLGHEEEARLLAMVGQRP